MFDYIEGKILDRGEDYIIVDKYGFGFFIYTPTPLLFEETDKVFVYLKLKEEEIRLYGFKTRQEREIFLKLLSIHGIGVKHAFSIMSHISIQDFIEAIETQNTILLSSLPGIGRKTANRLIVEFKGKLDFLKNQQLNELVEALVSLGYERDSANKVSIEIMKENIPLEKAIKEALKKLSGL